MYWLSLLVAADGKVHVLEGQRFLVENRQAVHAGVFPGGYVGVFIVVALGFAVRQLVFHAEVRAAGFLTVQGVIAEQLGEFPRKSATRQAFSSSALMPSAVPVTRTFSQNSFAELGNAFNGVGQAFFRAGHAAVFPHDDGPVPGGRSPPSWCLSRSGVC